MKKITVVISCPKEASGWELSVEKDFPETSAEWLEHLGEAALCAGLEKFTAIRAQDLGRRLKTGGKSTGPQKDPEIEEAVREFKLGVRTQVAARRRAPTPSEALETIRNMPAGPEKTRMIQEVMAMMTA
jgi:hypothetical protein